MKHLQTFESFLNKANLHESMSFEEIRDKYKDNPYGIGAQTVEYDTTNEAMVQIAGDKKPAGAQVLASLVVGYLHDNLILPSNVNKKKITEEIKQLIIDSTF